MAARDLLIRPAVPVPGHALERGPYPFGNVPAISEYSAWVRATWPGDWLDLMGGRAYDGSTAYSLNLYASLLAKRAYDLRVHKKPVEAVAYDPGSWAENDTDRPVLSTVPGKDADGNDFKVLPPIAEAPSMWALLAQDPVGITQQALEETYGIKEGNVFDSLLAYPAALLKKIFGPLLVPALIVGGLILIWKLPNFSKKGG